MQEEGEGGIESQEERGGVAGPEPPEAFFLVDAVGDLCGGWGLGGVEVG